jgi:hypothetical protein
MKRFIFSRGFSISGAIFCAFLLIAGLANSASAVQIYATSYDLTNGEARFLDDSYTGGSGNPANEYSPLAGGKGDLTDGITSPSNWDANAGPFVGWSDSVVPSPEIRFHFAQSVHLDQVSIYFNKLYVPSSVDFTMGNETKNDPFTIALTGGANTWYDFSNLDLTGDSLLIRLNDYPNVSNRDWIMIQEVTFNGSPVSSVPEPFTLLFLGCALVGVAGLGRKFKK